jgi:hypothetical protein
MHNSSVALSSRIHLSDGHHLLTPRAGWPHKGNRTAVAPVQCRGTCYGDRASLKTPVPGALSKLICVFPSILLILFMTLLNSSNEGRLCCIRQVFRLSCSRSSLIALQGNDLNNDLSPREKTNWQRLTYVTMA